MDSEGQSIGFGSLVCCLLGNFLLRAAAAAAGTLISLYLASLHQDGAPVRAQVVGLTAMLFYSAELLGSPAFGMLSDRLGRRPFMLLGPVFGGVAVQMIALAPVLPLILLARVLQGLSTASSVPSTLSYLSDETEASERLRGRVMSVFEVATIVGMAAGLASGGVLWDLAGHSAFAWVTAIYLLSVLLLWLVRDRRARARRSQDRVSFLTLLRSGSALRLIPAWIAVNAIVGLWLSHIDFQMGKADDPMQLLVGGFSGRQIGLYTAGVAIVFVLGIALWSLVFGRLRATPIMGFSVAGLFFLAGAIYLLNHTVPTNLPLLAGLVGIVGGLLLVVSGFTPAALVYLANLAEEFPENRGSMMGLYSVFLGVGQFLGSGLGGTFADWRGVDGMIVLTIILGAISALCVAALWQYDRRRLETSVREARWINKAFQKPSSRAICITVVLMLAFGYEKLFAGLA